ncbi:MAG: hypothetical protein J5I47_12645 [Vicingus serpentipes]|nr:hypothetical protein [Vicingus serpentipes]
MKSFLKHILLFILPFLMGTIYLYYAPYSKEYGYNYRNNVDCNTSWIYYRLFQNNQPIDIAFLGTSHTGCGINDSLIEKLINYKAIQNKSVANLAYCTIGRNIQLPLVKDLLTTKSPQVIVMEVTEQESTSSHQDFPYIADLNDVLQPPIIYPSVIKDIYNVFFCRFSYTRKRITKTLKYNTPASYKNNYSYVPFKFTADKEFLINHKKNQINRYKKTSTYLKSIQLEYPKSYIKKISQLASDQNVKIIFLYLPSYGTALKKPLNYNFYKNLGDVWIPPSHIFDNPANWVDGEHLNYKGANELGEWLTKQYQSIR